MAQIVSLLKTLKSRGFQKFYKIFFLIILLLSTTVFTEVILDGKREEYELIFPKFSYVKSLKNNNERFMFIQKHKLENSSNLIQLIETLLNDFSKKYKIFVKHNNIKANDSFNGLKIETHDIELISWHDAHIFEMIEKMEELSPGFVKIEKINITRTSNINMDSPALKVQILCKLYYKE